MKTLIHATTRANLASIRKHGLRCSRSRGKIKAVWLAKPTNERYVISHMLEKRECSLYDVVILRVKVSEESLRSFRHGLMYSVENISPENIIGIKSFVAIEECAW